MEVFDAVMVCTGHHVHPHIPKIYGMEDFRGPKLHSHEYKRPEPFQDNRVLVIGIFYAKCFFLLKSVFFIASFILCKSLQNVTLMCIKYVEIGI